MIFICYPKCSTCQKAKKWLDERNIHYTERHIVEDNPSYDELKEWYQMSGLPLKKFFNTSGLLYKEMQLKDKLAAMSEEEQLKLLATNGMLVKRPVIVGENNVLLGFKEDEWRKATRFEFRDIHADEADQAVAIEQICFPPNEACSEKSMKERIAKASEFFLVAVDKETGKLAGFLNGVATNEQAFRDEFFTDVDLFEPEGSHVMLLGLDVLPEYRGQGLARELVQQYVNRERAKGRSALVLTCLESKVKMYEKMGFYDHGIANSTWGGEEWHEMSLQI